MAPDELNRVIIDRKRRMSLWERADIFRLLYIYHKNFTMTSRMTSFQMKNKTTELLDLFETDDVTNKYTLTHPCTKLLMLNL